ncbi:hypothetical protein PQQ63_15255 [Paraburkholderia metrosideri]|uniref:Replicative helicase inhibitor G39P N-terminal domain-containing protein n=1 Tax=Paraburkholderia metrosideri TaxID=580937 RepID=A0ABW9DU35_9BURK
MQPADKAEFVKTLNLCYATLLKPLPPVESLGLWVTILEPYSIEQVRAALSQHMRESKFPPVPADVVTRLPKESDGRPDANEAWAIALRSRDERDTVVWTQECAEAFSICSAVLDGGDEVGARMAFKAAYERLAESARTHGHKVHWFMSLGHDPDIREAAAADAVRTGRLQIAQVRNLVPALAAPDASDTPDSAEQRAQLRNLLATIPSAAERLEKLRLEEVEKGREFTEEAKRATARRVAEYEGSHA